MKKKLFNDQAYLAMLVQLMKTKKPSRRMALNDQNDLFLQIQLLDDVACAAQLIDTPKHIANVDIDGAVQVFVKSDLMT